MRFVILILTVSAVLFLKTWLIQIGLQMAGFIPEDGGASQFFGIMLVAMWLGGVGARSKE